MSLNAFEIRFEMIKKADEFLWNKFIHDKNKWENDNQSKHIPDYDSYPQPPNTDDLIKLADVYKKFVDAK